MAEIRFSSKEHKNFFYAMLQTCGNTDNYHRIKPEGLYEGWQTGGTMRLTRLAFNLWNGYAEPGEEGMSTPYELFDCSYAPYFYEAVRQRYPEFCKELPKDKEKYKERQR